MARSSNQCLNPQEAILQQALIYEQLVERIMYRVELVERIMPQVELVEQRIMSQAIDFDREYQRLLNELPKLLAEQQEQFAEYQRRLATEIPERNRKALQRLGEEGWFIDPKMPLSLLQEIELLDEHPDEMAEWLSDFFRTQLDAIEGALVDSYPNRGHLLQQAFEAHREGKYGLSIPVFLTQADGIFWERTPERQNLFRSIQREKACNKYISQISDNYILAYLHPLSIILPLWMTQDKRGDSFVGLNRHQVLHGESVDYDTEQNSLKAISLLNYLRWIFNEIDERARGD